jgi:uncharacterized protein YuzE
MTDYPKVKRDTSTGALYATLRKGQHARTIEVTDSVMVDVDAEDHVLGIEMLSDTDWPGVLVNLAMVGRLIYQDPAIPPLATPDSIAEHQGTQLVGGRPAEEQVRPPVPGSRPRRS